MCIGEKREIVIPPSKGYGENGNPRMHIPGGTTLQFDVELLGFQEEMKPKPKPNVFKEMDVNEDKRITYDEMEIWFQTKHPKKLSSIPRGVWEKDDKNQDQIITWEEFSGPKGEEERLQVTSNEL
jgi:FK506-binding protein 9/10